MDKNYVSLDENDADDDVEIEISTNDSFNLSSSSYKNRNPRDSDRENGGHVTLDSLSEVENEDLENNNRNGSSKKLGSGSVDLLSSKSPGGTRRRTLRSSSSIEPPRDLEERHQALNQLGFGFKPFVNHVTKRPLEERSEVVRELYEKPKMKKDERKDTFINAGSLTWVILFGWWLSLIYIIVSGVLFVTIIGIPYAKICWSLKNYFFWPFGKFIIRHRSQQDMSSSKGFSSYTEESPLKSNGNVQNGAYQSTGSSVIGKIVWFLFAVPTLLISHAWTSLVCWMFVITIPMAKVNFQSMRMLFKNPLELSVTNDYSGPGTEVVIFTFRSHNVYYYKYSVFGINIVLLNMFPIVLLTMIMGYLVPEPHRPHQLVIFFGALISIVPLAYYIGMAVSSISAQSSLALGAILNASFGSIVELILYWTAIKVGKLDNFVQASITGSLLCTMLLIPGASMVAGGIKNKVQNFNQVSAGVSSVLLIVSLIGAFLPTIYYAALGSYSLNCGSCWATGVNSTDINGTSLHYGLNCSRCTYAEVDLDSDPRYTHGAKPLMYAVSLVLPIAYLVGLFFTLKTHAAYILTEAPKSEQKEEGHDTPEWGKLVCGFILLVCTLLFAGISDLLTVAVEDLSSSKSGLSQGFVGVFFIGVFGNAAELINAVSFGLRNNIALSLEIGYAGTIQTALIQIPGLVFFSAILNHGLALHSFILIFPTLNLFAIIFSVLIVNYISIHGKTNYFEGSALLLVYACIVIAFYFVPDS